jgi:hypothetical protein
MTSPSGPLLEIDRADRHATSVGAARRSEVGALPLLDSDRLGDREVEQRDRCPEIVASSTMSRPAATSLRVGPRALVVRGEP